MLNSEFHLAARAWAERNVPVFPCVAGTKRPATPHGFLDASTDPAQIDAWWSKDDFNVALSPGEADWTVLDVDPDKGGEDSLNALTLCHGELPLTFVVSTPSGGAHYYFQGATPRSSAGRLGDGLDTRSKGGYVLVPPSYTDKGAYTILEDTSLAPVPEWLVLALEAQRNLSSASEVDLDLPVNVERFADYMRTRPPAVEGARNDRGTVYVGVACDMGLSRDAAWPVIVEWGQRCSPPFGVDDKLYDCGLWTNRQNEGHPLALQGYTSGVFKLPDGLPKTFERFYPFTPAELLNRPAPKWLIPDILTERSIGHFYGITGSYKTYLTLKLAYQIAKTRPVVYVVGEGEDILARRVEALETMGGAEHLLRLVVDMPMIVERADVELFVSAMKAHEINPALVVLDTLATAMEGLDETTAKDMGRFVAAMKFVRDELGCAVLAIHHTGHTATDRERGSSALRAGVDFTGEIEGTEKHKLALLTMKKQRGAERRKQPFAFEGHKVGSEMALQEIELARYREIVGGGLAPNKVAMMLVEHGIMSEADAVSTKVLASWMLPMVEGDSIEDHTVKVAEVEADLKRRAPRELFGYCKGEGAKLRWFATAPPEV